MDATALMKSVDETLSGLSHFEGLSHLEATSPLVKRAQFIAPIQIETQSKFKIGYGVLAEPGIRPARETILVDGGRFLIVSGATVQSKVKPISARKPLPSDIASAWLLEYPSLMFAGIGSKATPFQSLIQSAKRDGLVVTVEQRSGTDNKRTFDERRVVITRTAAAAKKSGTLRYEIVITLPGKLPVMITTRLAVPNKPLTLTNWTSKWRHNNMFEKGTFDFPFGSK